MGKFIDILKKYSFGSYRTGLYHNNAVNFGSLFSVILSALFLLGLLAGVGYYFNEIFIQRPFHIDKLETDVFEDSELSKYSL